MSQFGVFAAYVVAIGCAAWGPQPVRSQSSLNGGHVTSPPVYAAGVEAERDPFGPLGGATASDETGVGATNLSVSDDDAAFEQESTVGPELSLEAVEDDVSDDEHDQTSHNPSYAKENSSGAALPHPLAHLSAAQLRQRLESAPTTLGPMSVGAPNGGALVNAVQLPENQHWQRVAASSAWGTQETIDYLSNAVGRVVEQFPDSPPIAIGHISDRNGGPIRPHRSHQSGADVDMGYYYKPEAHKWYQRATKANLDLPRTWALVRALVTETDVRMILIDHSIQAWLREYAESIREDSAWLDDIFGGKGGRRPALIRHAPGHATHLHVRFYNPIAEETASRCYADLVAMGKVKVAPSFVSYKVRKGDTLLALAKRFGTTVKAIKRANALRSNTILAKRVYKIPSSAKHKISMRKTPVTPPRRLPPFKNSSQTFSRL